MSSWQLGTISQADELEPILAIEQHSFRWPWGRLSFEGELSCQNACNYIAKSCVNGTDELAASLEIFGKKSISLASGILKGNKRS